MGILTVPRMDILFAKTDEDSTLREVGHKLNEEMVKSTYVGS